MGDVDVNDYQQRADEIAAEIKRATEERRREQAAARAAKRDAARAAVEERRKLPDKPRFQKPIDKHPPPTEEQIAEWKSRGMTRDPRNGRILPGCVIEGSVPLTPERARELARRRKEKYREATEKWLGEIIARIDEDITLVKRINPGELPYEAYGKLMAVMAEKIYKSDKPHPEAMKELAYALGARSDRRDVSEEDNLYKADEELVAARILMAALSLARGGDVVDGEFREVVDNGRPELGTETGSDA